MISVSVALSAKQVSRASSLRQETEYSRGPIHEFEIVTDEETCID